QAGTWDISADLSSSNPPPSGSCGYGALPPVPILAGGTLSPTPDAYPIAYVYERYFFTDGTQTIRMAFPGTDIARGGADGPYRVLNLATTDTSVVLRFRGDQIRQAGVDGPWDFSLTLYYAPLAYAGGNMTPGPIGTILPPLPTYYPETLCGTTSAYRSADFDDTIELVRYTGRFEEMTPDRNGHGTYDALVIRAEVEVFATTSFD